MLCGTADGSTTYLGTSSSILTLLYVKPVRPYLPPSHDYLLLHSLRYDASAVRQMSTTLLRNYQYDGSPRQRAYLPFDPTPNPHHRFVVDPTYNFHSVASYR